MKRVAVIAVVLSLTGCGASTGSGAGAGEPAGRADPTSEPAVDASSDDATSEDATSDDAYIDPADTARLNAASESVRRVTETANSREEYDACAGKPDTARTLRCFNALFEPVATALEEQSASLREFAGGAYGAECMEALRSGVRRTDQGVTAIEALIVRPGAPVATLSRVAERRYDVLVATYDKTQRAIADITEPCFSP